MSESLDYEDLLGNKFTLVHNAREERLKKEKEKAQKCPQKHELNRLIRSLFLTKPQPICQLEVLSSTYKSRTVKKFFQPGLVVQIDNRTTEAELQRLFHVGARTLFVRLGFATPGEINEIMSLINNSIELYQKDKPFISPIGLAVEIRGHQLRTGRVRNDKPLEIKVGDLMVLTCATKYQYVSVPQIVYVSNLSKYLTLIQLGDVIFMNKGKIRLRIVKVLNHNVTCCIEEGKLIRSYMNVELPYYVATNFEKTPQDIEDIQFAKRYNAQFIVLPAASNAEYIKQFRRFMENSYNCDLFAAINTCIATNKCIAKDIIQNCDGIWLDKLFKREKNQLLIDENMLCVVQLGKKLELPIIGKIPIKVRPDFAKLQDHEVLPFLDSILIEKSPRTLTFPLIARKLFCIQRQVTDEPEFPTKESTGEININNALAEPINFHISIQKCVAIIISSKISYETAVLLSRKHVYCPIIVVAESEPIAKRLNLYRNLKVVLFKSSSNSDVKRLEYGMDFGLWSKLLAEGDFIISFYDSIYYECVNSKYRALYVPKKNVDVARYDRIDYNYNCVPGS